jgi:hypothetical protein
MTLLYSGIRYIGHRLSLSLQRTNTPKNLETQDLKPPSTLKEIILNVKQVSTEIKRWVRMQSRVSVFLYLNRPAARPTPINAL